MRSFEIPEYFRSPIISRVKDGRKKLDPRKSDFSPTLLDFGSVKILLARHFGFCFGVENAIEISYKAIAENPGKRIFLLSQMIHNPEVNEDLESRGVRFLHDTKGRELTPFSEVADGDVVIIPAFGATLEMKERLSKAEVIQYNTTCPFVEKVWKRSDKLGSNDFTIVIHGKPDHEETRATFSHASANGPAIVIADFKEADLLAQMLKGGVNTPEQIDAFWNLFEGRTSEGFDPTVHLDRVGVVNQTTMIAAETNEIAEHLKSAVGIDRFSNTRDTLCYATNDNQKSTYGALEANLANLAIVVGGYNSSNTSHIVELCEKHLPTYFVRNELEWCDSGEVSHFNIHTQQLESSSNILPDLDTAPTILITSGASCPDASLERVVKKVLSNYGVTSENDVEDVLKNWEAQLGTL